jgi:hypothetical protein
MAGQDLPSGTDRITALHTVRRRESQLSTKKISKPMRVVALRLTDEERTKLQRVADENDVTLSWVIRQGAKLYAEDLAKWLEERKRIEGDIGRRLAAE